jgi:hypothetical protein
LPPAGSFVAAIDWWTEHYIPLGFLYLFPIAIAWGLSGTTIVAVALHFAAVHKNRTQIHLIFNSGNIEPWGKVPIVDFVKRVELTGGRENQGGDRT